MTITQPQLARLQTVCSQMTRNVIGFDGSRDARIAWAVRIIGRPIDSFSKLTNDEGRRLIDIAQGELGHRAPLKPGARRRTPQAARRHGLDGRRGDVEFADAPEMVTAADLANIVERYERLGWSRAEFDAWLAKKSSPLRGRKTISTTAEANKVLWGLKGMLQAKGLWADWSE